MERAGKGISIKRATILDAEEFLSLEARCFGLRFSKVSLYYWRPVIDYCWAFKAMRGNTILGGVVAMPTRQGRIYINSLFVRPEMRNRGIGTKLFRAVLSLKSERGFILDLKTSKPHLREMYESYGFKVLRTERNYYLDDSDRVLMVLRKDVGKR